MKNFNAKKKARFALVLLGCLGLLAMGIGNAAAHYSDEPGWTGWSSWAAVGSPATIKLNAIGGQVKTTGAAIVNSNDKKTVLYWLSPEDHYNANIAACLGRGYIRKDGRSYYVTVPDRWSYGDTQSFGYRGWDFKYSAVGCAAPAHIPI